ncbi:MAG TPA: hypothetical protein VKF82_07505 [Candidatus Eremiobacteraceae bacterium]|nr:hypothetical protein [Candidatus Eremiobacteraceae bacterium]
MTEQQRSWLVIVISGIVILVVLVAFVGPYLKRESAVNQVLTARSTWTVTMQQYLHRGPLSEQTYRISNDDGKVSMFFSATNRDSTITKQFEVPLFGPEATFLFEQLRAEGIWSLLDKPVRPHPEDEYVFLVAQTLGDEGGQRVFGFSDPEYWATTKGQEYPVNIKDPKNPIGVAGGRPLRDPQYLKLVQLVESFGPASVQQAEAKIRAELAASNGAAPHPKVGAAVGAH